MISLASRIAKLISRSKLCLVCSSIFYRENSLSFRDKETRRRGGGSEGGDWVKKWVGVGKGDLHREMNEFLFLFISCD